MVERAEVRSPGARGLGLSLLRMPAMFKPVNSVRLFPRRRRNKELSKNSAFETSLILLCPIAYSCVPARDVPFFAHVVTSAPGAFPVCLLVRLHPVRDTMRINRPVDCFKDFCVSQVGPSSGVDGETNNLQCLSCFCRHQYLRLLGNTNIDRPRILIKRLHLYEMTRCGLSSNDPRPRCWV
jgi:hypothetical protein